MYFHLLKGKQHLDMTGDLVLSHNDAFIKARISSAAPMARNGRSIVNIPELNWFLKFQATMAAIRFIWGPSAALTAESIQALTPFKKE